MISREQFMEYWRDSKMDEELTPEDRMEIFISAPIGSSDITKTVLDKILCDYGVDNLEIIDHDHHIQGNEICG